MRARRGGSARSRSITAAGTCCLAEIEESAVCPSDFKRAEGCAVHVEGVLDRPAVLVVRGAFHRQQWAPRVSFKSVPRLPLPPEHRSSRSRSGDGAVAVQDIVQAPSFQVLLGERDDRRRNLVAHQGERYIARVAPPFDGVDAAALGDAEGVAVLSKAFTSMNDSTLVCDSRPAMFRSS